MKGEGGSDRMGRKPKFFGNNEEKAPVVRKFFFDGSGLAGTGLQSRRPQ
jgi:hypothetical protein